MAQGRFDAMLQDVYNEGVDPRFAEDFKWSLRNIFLKVPSKKPDDVEWILKIINELILGFKSANASTVGSVIADAKGFELSLDSLIVKRLKAKKLVESWESCIQQNTAALGRMNTNVTTLEAELKSQEASLAGFEAESKSQEVSSNQREQGIELVAPKKEDQLSIIKGNIGELTGRIEKLKGEITDLSQKVEDAIKQVDRQREVIEESKFVKDKKPSDVLARRQLSENLRRCNDLATTTESSLKRLYNAYTAIKARIERIFHKNDQGPQIKLKK